MKILELRPISRRLLQTDRGGDGLYQIFYLILLTVDVQGVVDIQEHHGVLATGV